MREFNGFRARFGARAGVRLVAVVLLPVLAAGCADRAQKRSAPAIPAAGEQPAQTLQRQTLRPVEDGRRAAASSRLSLHADVPLHYVVRKGDTLWAIASYYLRDPWEWPQLWYDNPQIKNPHLIYPGDVLDLVWVNGHPRLTNRGGTRRLEPHVRHLPLNQATPGIPYAAIRDFLEGPRLVDAEEIARAPYVVDFTGAHLIGSAGDGVFVKNLPPDPATVWQIVHIGKQYRDPDTGEVLGEEAIPTGRCTLQRSGSPARLLITRNDRETSIGDRLLPVTADSFHADFFPHPPPHAIDGSIISVFGGVTEVGEHQIVTLDRGSKDGLDAGTVLRIMQAPKRVPDPLGVADSTVLLPAQPAGLLMVFKAAPHLSYALVMNVTKPVRVLDRVAAPRP